MLDAPFAPRTHEGTDDAAQVKALKKMFDDWVGAQQVCDVDIGALTSININIILLLVKRMSRGKLLRSLKAVNARRQALLRELMRADPLIVGTVCEVLRRCGTTSCHCAQAPGHRQTLLLYGKAGRRTSKFIRQEDVARVRRDWCRYRSCRKALGEIRALNIRESVLMRAQIRARSVNYE